MNPDMRERCEKHPEGGLEHEYIYCYCDILKLRMEVEELRKAVHFYKYDYSGDSELQEKLKAVEAEYASFKATVYHDEVCCSNCAMELKSITSQLSICREALVMISNYEHQDSIVVLVSKEALQKISEVK